MADTYLTISRVAADAAMRSRVAAAYAQQQNGPASSGAESWSFTNSYWWASAPGWAEAYEYAELSDNKNPGADPAVITDAQILTQVQFMLNGDGAP